MKQISETQILKNILTENTWWEKGISGIPKIYAELSPRAYLEIFYPLVRQQSVRRGVVLMGPRRVGKTVLIHHLIQKLMNENVTAKRIGFFSVDHPVYNGLSLEDFLELYQKITKVDFTKESCFIFFDEIQYLKDWERHAKIIIDRYPNVKCVVSGSAAAALKLKSTESGAGRFTDFLLPPLTFYEYLSLLKKEKLIPLRREEESIRTYGLNHLNNLNEEFLKYINFGGYPEVIFNEEIQLNTHRFIKSDIIDKVLLRDLPSLYGIDDIQELNSLFTTLAFNTANEISLEQLSVHSGVAKNTIKRYIDYLEAAFLIKVVHRVDKNAKKFKRANYFKVYLTNPSLRTALFSPITKDDDNIGALVETAVFSQWFHSDTVLYYARWNKGEIDIVLLDEKKQKINDAIEVKWTNRLYHHQEELTNYIDFCHTNNLQAGFITTLTKGGIKTLQSIDFHYIPASILCFDIGYNLIRGKKALAIASQT